MKVMPAENASVSALFGLKLTLQARTSCMAAASSGVVVSHKDPLFMFDDQRLLFKPQITTFHNYGGVVHA